MACLHDPCFIITDAALESKCLKVWRLLNVLRDRRVRVIPTYRESTDSLIKDSAIHIRLTGIENKQSSWTITVSRNSASESSLHSSVRYSLQTTVAEKGHQLLLPFGDSAMEPCNGSATQWKCAMEARN